VTRQPLPEPFIVADAVAWRAWLDQNEDRSDGVWLVLAKKGVVGPTSLVYQDALEESLCSGWIDGQRRSFDDRTFLQRFTPRRRRSVWSQRNVETVERLVAEGRLRPRGLAEVELAHADGRWERAYHGQASAEIPAELVAALRDQPVAGAAFDALSKAERYSVIHPILIAPNEATRLRRVARAVERLGAE